MEGVGSADEEGQWIVLMGFVISISLFFLVIVINQSVTVGQTTSEAVLEFPKSEISEVRDAVEGIAREEEKGVDADEYLGPDLRALAMDRMNAVVGFDIRQDRYSDLFYRYDEITIRFNDGVTIYNETFWLPQRL